MNLGLLKGISKNIDHSIANISDVLCLEDNKLNYENKKRLLVSFETLKTIGIIIHCMINEEENNMYNEDK